MHDWQKDKVFNPPAQYKAVVLHEDLKPSSVVAHGKYKTDRNAMRYLTKQLIWIFDNDDTLSTVHFYRYTGENWQFFGVCNRSWVMKKWAKLL